MRIHRYLRKTPVLKKVSYRVRYALHTYFPAAYNSGIFLKYSCPVSLFHKHSCFFRYRYAEPLPAAILYMYQPFHLCEGIYCQSEIPAMQLHLCMPVQTVCTPSHHLLSRNKFWQTPGILLLLPAKPIALYIMLPVLLQMNPDNSMLPTAHKDK